MIRMPLDKLSATVMLAQAQDDDLLELYGPFGRPFGVAAVPTKDPVWRAQPTLTERLYCRPHLLLRIHRANGMMHRRDKELGWVEKIITEALMKDWLDAGLIRLFGMRKAKLGTWDQCPHCRWQERNRARLHHP
jgi:hypothetical protein